MNIVSVNGKTGYLKNLIFLILKNIQKIIHWTKLFQNFFPYEKKILKI